MALGAERKDAVTLIKARPKLQLKNQFVFLFFENFKRLSKELSKTELLVLFGLLEFLEYSNVLKITQAAVAKSIGLSRPNVSRAWKNLVKQKIILKDEEGVEFINPCVLGKGNLLEQKKALPSLEKVYGSLETTLIQSPF